MSPSPLFGTDGIRGTAYQPPLDRDTVFRVGLALAEHLGPKSPRILIGRDTRESGPDIETWLASGIAAGGGRAYSAGVLTTPAIAFLTRHEGFDGGVVISASHNPYRDNGIKIFGAQGSKSNEELQDRIERAVRNETGDLSQEQKLEAPHPHFENAYIEHLVGSLGDVVSSLPTLRIALDCAHGAGYRVGPRLLERLGVEPISLSVEPTGRNINERCGSTHPERTRAVVLERGCDLGAALDGDGDRLQLVDSQGRLIDGDAILLLCARRLKKEGRLQASGVVATVMSNMALELALAEEGISLHRTAVGDKFVAQEMSERNIIIGGEQSGHIIFSEHASTGDGLLTLMQVLRVVALEGGRLDELGRLEPFPQVLVNVRVKERPDVRGVPRIADAIEQAERALGGRGRVLVRYSGTEPLLRIMMEGPDKAEIETLAGVVSRAVEESIGASR